MKRLAHSHYYTEYQSEIIDLEYSHRNSVAFRRSDNIRMSSSVLQIRHSVSPILNLTRWTGVLPLIQCEKSIKHSPVTYSYEVSKFWSIYSVVVQMLFAPFAVILIIDLISEFSKTELLWNAMKVMFLVHEVEMYAILVLGAVQAKPIAALMNQLANMPSNPEDIKWIGRFLRIALGMLLLFFGLYSTTNILHFWVERPDVNIFSVKNFGQSIVGLLLHNYLAIFTQAQCMLCVMVCLLTCSKFKYLTNIIRVAFNQTSPARSFITINPNQNQKIQVLTYNSHFTPEGGRNSSFKIDTEYLEELHRKYCEINDCLDQINKRIGFQLMLSISVILYTLIFFIFCEITIEGYNDDVILMFSSVFGIVVLIIRLVLYMWAGHKIKDQAMEPLNSLQHARLIHHSQPIQQQLQTILLQWSTTEPGCLSAFQIMNVGPWLITSIIGNVITYLLVFVQISKMNS